MKGSRSTRYIPALLLTAAFAVAIGHGSVSAQQMLRPEEVVDITPALPKTGFYPGQTFEAAVVLKIAEGYHLNAHGTKDPRGFARSVALRPLPGRPGEAGRVDTGSGG